MLPRQRQCEISPPVAHSLGLTTTPAGQIALHIKSVRVAGGFPQFTGRCPTSLSRANGMGGPLRGGRNRLAVSPRPLDCNVQPLSSSIHGTDRPLQLRRYLLHAPSFRDHRAQLMVVLRRPFFQHPGHWLERLLLQPSSALLFRAYCDNGQPNGNRYHGCCTGGCDCHLAPSS